MSLVEMPTLNRSLCIAHFSLFCTPLKVVTSLHKLAFQDNGLSSPSTNFSSLVINNILHIRLKPFYFHLNFLLVEKPRRDVTVYLLSSDNR
jgi:hypothetical protein